MVNNNVRRGVIYGGPLFLKKGCLTPEWRGRHPQIFQGLPHYHPLLLVVRQAQRALQASALGQGHQAPAITHI